jgi:hypothetical protein
MLVGPNGKPIMTRATVIGAPKIQDFPPLQEKELHQIINQVQDGFNQGASPQTDVGMPAFAIARLIQTVFAMQGNALITLGLLKHCIDTAEVEFNDEQKSHLTQLLPNLFPPKESEDGLKDNDKD